VLEYYITVASNKSNFIINKYMYVIKFIRCVVYFLKFEQTGNACIMSYNLTRSYVKFVSCIGSPKLRPFSLFCGVLFHKL